MLKGKTPFEILFNNLPSYFHLKSFVRLAYVHDHGMPKEKFRARDISMFSYIIPMEKKVGSFMIYKHKNFSHLGMFNLLNLNFRFHLLYFLLHSLVLHLVTLVRQHGCLSVTAHS